MKKTEFVVDRGSDAYKKIMEAAKDATPANGINTRGMLNVEFLRLLFTKK